MILLVMGPQGSGKSTQAKMIAEKYGMDFVSTGEVLRELYEDQYPIGIKAHEYWVKGELVPDTMVIEIMQEYFRKHGETKDYVVDGFPRDIGEYEVMNSVFPSELDAVIYLNLDRAEIMKRLTKRAQIENREDENPTAIQKRLEIAEEITYPLLKRFKDDHYLVIEIDGKPSPEVIFQKICTELEGTHALVRIKND